MELDPRHWARRLLGAPGNDEDVPMRPGARCFPILLVLIPACLDEAVVVATRAALGAPQLRVGPERSTDPSPALDALAENSQHSPDLACAAGQCLLVWQDQRRLEGDDIFGARLDPAGKILDPQGLPINTVQGTQEAPQVASDGTGFLVVWYDYGRGGVYATVVDGNGQPLQPDGVLLGAGSEPAVAFDGSNYLVAWRTAGGDIRAGRVSPAGAALDPQGLTVCSAVGLQARPALTFGTTHYLVTWHDWRGGGAAAELYAGRLIPAGLAEDGDGFKLASAVDGAAARVGHDGTNFVVTWSAETGGTGPDVFARRVGPGGALLEPAPLTVSQESGVQGNTDVAFDGQSFVVAWHHQTSSASFDIRSLRLSQALVPVETQSVTVAGGPLQEARPALAPLAGATVVAWDTEASKGGSQDVYVTELSAGGVPGKPGGSLVTAAAVAQHDPVVARNQGQQLLAWRQTSALARHIHGQHLDDQGGALGPPLQLSAGAGVWDIQVFIGGGLPTLLAWTRYDDAHPELGTDLFGARIGLSGGALAPGELSLVSTPGEQTSPALAFDGQATGLAVWEHQQIKGNLEDVYFARIGADGAVIDGSGLPLASSQDSEGRPAVAFGAGTYLVAWETVHKEAGKRADIQWALVSAAGKPQAVQTLPKPNSNARDALNPKVAFDGTSFLIVYEWHDHGQVLDPTALTWNIYAARVSPKGQVLDPQSIPLSAVIGSDEVLLINPDVVFDGASYVVTWQDEFLSGIEARRLDPAGKLLEPQPVLVSGDAAGQKLPRLGLTPDGRVTVAYEKYDALVGSWRVHHRVLFEDSAGVDAGVEAGPLPDAGAGEGAAPTPDQGGAEPTPSTTGCSCGVALGGEAGTGPLPLLLALLLGWRRARR